MAMSRLKLSHIGMNILKSKWLRVGISIVLFYFAFRRVNILSIIDELKAVPVWFLIFIIFYQAAVMVLGSYRWSLLLFDKPTRLEVWNFTRSTFYGQFYSLVFPTGVAGDLLKWLPLQKEYPQLSSVKLLSSSLVDRIVGFTAFILVAFTSSVLGRLTGIPYPPYLMLVFGAFFVGVVIFYILIFSFDVHRILSGIKALEKPLEIIDLLKGENKNRLLKCLAVAFVSEFTWITPIWFTSNVFSAGMSLLSVYIIIPMVTLILVLPVSVAGFGARENLYLLFFEQLGLNPVKILAVSTFNGIIQVLLALVGGVWSLLGR